MTAKRRASAPKEVSFQAFDLSYGGVGFFFVAVKPSEIFKYTRVSRVAEDAETGFQRALEASRVKKISEYLSSGKVVPGAIIVSAQDSSKVKYDENTGRLTFSAEEDLFLVIDGQHRLYGAVKAEKEHDCQFKIPVCILSELTHPEEIQYFIDINGNQKGVSKTLRIELTKFLVEEDSVDDIRLRLFNDLNAHVDSPLFGHLSPTQRRVGVISHVPFKAALDRLLEKDPLKKLDYDKKLKLLLNYTRGINRNLEEADQDKRLFQSAFFQAIFRVFEKACEMSLMYYRDYTEESFYRIFKPLQDLNYDSFSGSNEEAISNISKEIALILEISLTATKFSDDLL